MFNFKVNYVRGIKISIWDGREGRTDGRTNRGGYRSPSAGTLDLKICIDTKALQKGLIKQSYTLAFKVNLNLNYNYNYNIHIVHQVLALCRLGKSCIKRIFALSEYIIGKIRTS